MCDEKREAIVLDFGAHALNHFLKIQYFNHKVLERQKQLETCAQNYEQFYTWLQNRKQPKQRSSLVRPILQHFIELQHLPGLTRTRLPKCKVFPTQETVRQVLQQNEELIFEYMLQMAKKEHVHIKQPKWSERWVKLLEMTDEELYHLLNTKFR